MEGVLEGVAEVSALAPSLGKAAFFFFFFFFFYFHTIRPDES